MNLPFPADKARYVEAMFDRIAPRYDLMNRLLTLRLDQTWRRRMIRLAKVGTGDLVVDMGCGTGDVCALAAATGARVIGVDFSVKMLDAARHRKVPATLLRADVSALPLANGVATVVTSAFALRNVVSVPRLLCEAARVLASGGRLALLEVDRPASRLARKAHAIYFRKVVPIVGGLLSDRTAYDYLPQSTAYLPAEPDLLAAITAAGFSGIIKNSVGAGAAQLIVAVKA